MAFIETTPVDQATGDVRAMYEGAQAGPGYVPNYARIFSHRPPVMAAWGNLIGAIHGPIDLRRFELVTIAAAGSLRSSYCMLAHGRVLRQQVFTAEQVTAIAADFTNAGLSSAEVAMMSFAAQIARDATEITEPDIQGLRAHGFSDTEIFDIAATAAARCFFTKLLDALGAEPDSAFLELEDELRAQLTVGRPISHAPVETMPAPAPLPA
jgi:uncharacterized peroxidase-related enzyme